MCCGGSQTPPLQLRMCARWHPPALGGLPPYGHIWRRCTAAYRLQRGCQCLCTHWRRACRTQWPGWPCCGGCWRYSKGPAPVGCRPAPTPAATCPARACCACFVGTVQHGRSGKPTAPAPHAGRAGWATNAPAPAQRATHGRRCCNTYLHRRPYTCNLPTRQHRRAYKGPPHATDPRTRARAAARTLGTSRRHRKPQRGCTGPAPTAYRPRLAAAPAVGPPCTRTAHT